MSAGFTPGPWTVDDGGIRCDHSHNYGIVAQARDGHCYSEYTSDPATLEFENVADVHLIAAAPELYRHLEAAVDALEAFGVKNGGLPEMKAALAKARGEA